MEADPRNAAATPAGNPATGFGHIAVVGAQDPQRAALLDWLDDGLRAGRRGRLRGEYGAALDDGSAEHVVAFDAGRRAAHALLRSVRVHSMGVELPIGMIGCVYTDPGSRRRGLASRCVEAAAARLRERGAALALLWSDRPAFYARLGFQPTGRERLYLVEPALFAAARTDAPGPVSPARRDDWAELEALYAAKPVRAERAPGYLASLASGPECSVVVCRREERPIAYAALGRGDDLREVIHEWAGEPAGVLACLERLCAERGQLLWLTGPFDEPPAPLLRRAGAFFRDDSAALGRVLDPGALPGAPAGVPGVERLLVPSDPWPVFVWGFDSI